MITTTIEIDTNSIPDTELHLLSRDLVEVIQQYFEDPEVQADFEKWQKERRALKK